MTPYLHHPNICFSVFTYLYTPLIFFAYLLIHREISIDKSYLAAPNRKRLSPLIRKLLNLGILEKNYSHLDYGCGFGQDVERLRSQFDFNSTGYDPHYFPISPKNADIVTMNYVLNVISDFEQRKEALLKAWNLTNKILAIATNIQGGINSKNKKTRWETYTKSFNYIELKGFIESTLGYELVRIDKDKFMISRDGYKYDSPMTYKEVITKIEQIKLQGWIPPKEAVIKGYCNDFKPRYIGKIDPNDNPNFPGRIRYYRMYSKIGGLPGKNGMVKCLHIPGGKDGEAMKQAIAAIKRRDEILKIKFHCLKQSFVQEFAGYKNFNFLKNVVTFYE
ncbi:hypothetical protein [Anabaena sp. UHCC 0451]|uniref:hypothetical protein n=1 Tax=Anabaena sp. UHCC 0451 TaxID=2055235 RepID=UPI002B1F6CB0|nr:hypothetical protein [Anabaena sp. UHCC 0451]MEA5578641.1 hypothetical protein [Anabaena sp. UHCC 0451]